MDKQTTKKSTLFIILSFLSLALLGGGIYFLVQSLGKSTPTINVNRYSETISLCETNIQNNTLEIQCKGLLLDIYAQDENEICFDVEVISRDMSSKNISICEQNEAMVYTNDILQYKKLMPIDTILTYERTDRTNNYSFTNVSFVKLDGTYVQDILNADIANLVTIDPSKTTIQNSVDFCPNPKSLVDYLTEDNYSKYTNFYNENILSEKEYRNLLDQEFKTPFLENWTDPTINILFACESASRVGYKTICNPNIDSKYDTVALTAIPTDVSNWNNLTNTEGDLLNFKNLSLVLDGMMYSSNHENYSSVHIVSQLFQYIYDAGMNQNVYCSADSMYEQLAQYNNQASTQLNLIQTQVTTNLQTSSKICLNILNNQFYNSAGLYLKSYNTEDTTNFMIYNRCNSLYLFISNQ